VPEEVGVFVSDDEAFQASVGADQNGATRGAGIRPALAKRLRA
jgi:hypothetical protein